METTSVDESIRVGVAFDSGRALPVWFWWRNRYYRIKDVTYTWCTNLGLARLHHYSVSDGANLYELKFNTTTLDWTLGKVCSG